MEGSGKERGRRKQEGKTGSRDRVRKGRKKRKEERVR
jgi:hypothetical protein